MLDTVQEIQERHSAVKDLERQLLGLHQIFLDMAVLVEAQGELLDNIETQVAKANEYVNQGNKALTSAKALQKSTRKWMCCVLFICVAIVLVVVLVITKPWAVRGRSQAVRCAPHSACLRRAGGSETGPVLLRSVSDHVQFLRSCPCSLGLPWGLVVQRILPRVRITVPLECGGWVGLQNQPRYLAAGRPAGYQARSGSSACVTRRGQLDPARGGGPAQVGGGRQVGGSDPSTSYVGYSGR